jgi:hypothetical protein
MQLEMLAIDMIILKSRSFETELTIRTGVKTSRHVLSLDVIQSGRWIDKILFTNPANHPSRI